MHSQAEFSKSVMMFRRYQDPNWFYGDLKSRIQLRKLMRQGSYPSTNLVNFLLAVFIQGFKHVHMLLSKFMNLSRDQICAASEPNYAVEMMLFYKFNSQIKILKRKIKHTP